MKYRTCKSGELSTGLSACPYDREKVIGALVVKHGQKLPANLTGTSLEEACHANRPERVMPVVRFVEYAKNGGEVQVSAVGYGPNEATGVAAWTDAYTLDKYNDVLKSSLLKTMNSAFDVYFFDENNVIYGLDDGTDQLAGFPMSSIYPTDTPYPTSGAKATLLVNFCYKDARKAMENANFEQLDFDIARFAYGLVPVKFVSTGAKKFKIVEVYGGLDRTEEFQSVITANPSDVIKESVTTVSYADGELTVTATGDVSALTFKDPAALYTAGIKGVEGCA